MITIVTPPALEPVTLDTLKAQIRIELSDTSQDAFLTAKIKAAREWVERRCSVQLVDTIAERKYGMLPNRLRMPVGNVKSIVSITYLDADDVVQTLSPDHYRLVHDVLCILEHPDDIDSEFPMHTIRFVAGYGAQVANMPTPLTEAILILAASMERSRVIDNNWADGQVGYLLTDFIYDHGYL